MSDNTFSDFTWEMCVSHYQSLKEHEQEREQQRQLEGYPPSNGNWEPFVDGMLNLIDVIRKDENFPEVRKIMSHATLRFGLPEKSSRRGVDVWIHWQEPNHYSVQLGMVGYEKIIVPADKVLQAIKQYFKLSQKLSQPRPPFNQPIQPPEKMYSKEHYLHQYSQIPHDWVHTNVIRSIQQEAYPARLLLRMYFDGKLPNFDLSQVYRMLERIDTILDAAEEYYLDYHNQNFFALSNDD